MNYKYGWKKDKNDSRDFKYKFSLSNTELPSSVELPNDLFVVLNQGELGSCTANSLANAYRYAEIKEKGTIDYIPSRLFIYYYERLIEGTIDEDNGAELRDGAKVLANYGAPDENIWAYDVTKFTIQPCQEAVDSASKHKVLQYHSVNQNERDIKQCLFEGFPISFGFTVFEEFESESVAKTGLVPMPSHMFNSMGGHAVLLVGYNDDTKLYKVLNSWGNEWGDNGYFYLPYDYVHNQGLASDFWTIRFIQE
jgi:C1A family cysteine protease